MEGFKVFVEAVQAQHEHSDPHPQQALAEPRD